jgi:3-oxoacyl-[acyl-carrier protein] reductase
MNDIRGRKALVTGGASGIGAAISRELAALGAEVFIHYHSSFREAKELARSIAKNSGKAFTHGADLATEDGVASLFARVTEAFGRLDILVNNSGDLVGRSRLEDMSHEFIRKVLGVNLESMMLVTRAAIPLLRLAGGASIVNLASLAGRKGGHAGSTAYATAKGAVLSFTRAMAQELASYGIRVNAVAPGLILGSRFHAVHTSQESKRQTIAQIPLGRAGTCEDVARAVAFLASEHDGFITGATLDVNGGVYMA